ncbi:MAG: DUF5664 domain-containing protein [Bacteroidia bacterium]|nr:DUF5664 domain-containing protein [Bacteroidia bacterium]
MKKQGKKFDTNKPPIHLLTKEAVFAIAEALNYGAKKYGKYNFQDGIEYTRLIDAALRHLFQFVGGEDNDRESGLSHIAHAGANIVMLLWMIANRNDLDDRPRKNKKYDM